MAKLAAHRTRYFCRRCKRPLVNDRAAKPPTEDTVTATVAVNSDRVRWVHDGCGGPVRPENG